MQKRLDRYKILALCLFFIVGIGIFPQLIKADSHLSKQPIVIGLNADMSSGSAQAGESIKRGILVAIEELNQDGGLLGRLLQLKVADHRGIPARGRANVKKFAANSNVVAIVGGLHTPVMLAEKKALFDTGKVKIPYLTPWAAGTPVVDNPWIFRVSVRDEYAGPFLVEKALSLGYKNIAMLLERTPWGRGNEKSITAALKKSGMVPNTVQWFRWKITEAQVIQKLNEISKSQADVILLVANAPEGATVIKSLAKQPKEQRLPVISHWGITGGGFPERVGSDLGKVNLSFLQTYSFMNPTNASKARQFMQQAIQLFPEEIKSPADLTSPVGTAHAYDLIHLLARAIRQAKSADRSLIRDNLERLKRYQGLVRIYAPPFQAGQGRNHDALDVSDFNLSRFVFVNEQQGWVIQPVTAKAP
ncbi:MAG: ABC transporter substrate-binding protein [SAR324 cluster bacterium]|nr:ABC transporter substrate-binding protein [SAR324 cluster bacterium]